MAKRFLSGGLLVALLIALVPATTSAAQSNVVATGLLKDSHGHGAQGRVYAMVWPGEDYLRTLPATIDTPLVGQADTDRLGRFSIGIDDASVPATHRRRDGGVNLLLVGTDGTSEALMFQPASSPSQATALSADAAADVVPSVTLRMTFALSSTGRVAATAAKSTKFTPYAAPPPATYPCHGWSKEGSSSLVWVSMGQSYSGPATNYAVLAQESSTTNGTAFSATGTYGSWSASGSQTLTTGNTKTWTESLADRDFQSQFQYSRWVTICQGFNRHAFTPDFGTGGDAEPAATSYPARNYCTSTSPGLWSRSSSSGSAYSSSVGVKAQTELGINLSVSHNYSSSSTTKFTLNYRNSTTQNICGDTNYPALASKPRI